MADEIEIGSRVKYADFACSGVGFMRAVNGCNAAVVFVEVEEKDRAHAWYRLAHEGEYSFGMGVISEKGVGRLRPFWRREIQKR